MTQASSPLRRVHRRFAGLRAVGALVLREMSTTYGRSAAGYFWAIAEPVAAIALLSLAFSMFIRTPPLGQSFILFYATGFLPLAAHQAIVTNVSLSIRFSRALLAYPTVTYMDALLARLVLATITHGLVFLVVIGGALLVQHGQTNIDFTIVLRAWAMVVVLGAALGAMNCFLMGLVPAWQSIWSVINRPMFLVSGVLFLIDGLPESVRSFALVLPTSHFIMMMRRGFYNTYDAPYVSETYVYAVALSIGALAMLLLRRYHRQILSEP